jgi:hypothetical protein
VVIVVLEGLQQFFSFYENWLTHRATAEASSTSSTCSSAAPALMPGRVPVRASGRVRRGAGVPGALLLDADAAGRPARASSRALPGEQGQLAASLNSATAPARPPGRELAPYPV